MKYMPLICLVLLAPPRLAAGEWPKGYWKRTDISSLPCIVLKERISLVLDVEDVEKAQEKVMAYFAKRDNVQVELSCRVRHGLPRNRDSRFKPKNLDFIIDPKQLEFIKKDLLKIGGFVDTGTFAGSPDYESTATERHRLLSTEYAHAEQELKDAPRTLSLIRAEIRRLEKTAKDVPHNRNKTVLQLILYRSTHHR